MTIKEAGAVAGSVSALIALGWVLLTGGHAVLKDHETIVTHEERLESSDKLHAEQIKIQNKLANVATQKEVRLKAKASQCKKFIDAGKLTEADCDPTPP